MPKENKNIAASVKERLKNIAKQSDKEFQNLLTQYVSERFLFRLSKSIYESPLKSNILANPRLQSWGNELKTNYPKRTEFIRRGGVRLGLFIVDSFMPIISSSKEHSFLLLIE